MSNSDDIVVVLNEKTGDKLKAGFVGKTLAGLLIEKPEIVKVKHGRMRFERRARTVPLKNFEDIVPYINTYPKEFEVMFGAISKRINS